MYNLSDLTRDEKSLLLFLETQAVDYGGLVDIRHMNATDMKIAKRWNKEGLIDFGRLCFDDANRLSKNRHQATHYVQLTEDAFHLTHQERIARSVRMFSKRTWKKAGE